MCQHIFEKNIIKSLKHKVIIDIMYPLYKFAKGETTMSQIKLTPEDLRTSAQKYTRGSEDVSQVLSSLKHEQEVIRGNWDGSAFRSFDAQHYLQRLKNLHTCFKILMLSYLKLLTLLKKQMKVLLHKFTNFVITALGRQEPSYFCKD